MQSEYPPLFPEDSIHFIKIRNKRFSINRSTDTGASWYSNGYGKRYISFEI
jgi:hypothetical protein